MILSVPIPIPTDKNGTFKKTPSGGRVSFRPALPDIQRLQLPVGAKNIGSQPGIPASSTHPIKECNGDPIHQMAASRRLTGGFRKKEQAQFRLAVHTIRYFHNLYSHLCSSKSHLCKEASLCMMILKKAIQGLGYIGTHIDLSMFLLALWNIPHPACKK